ncbi:hypothetical protein V1478_001377 [Vespula squamosa]|uniref:Uncharacterized protein n=1 Tax=Vespula squamosa TaxID=30214 RepID=A0ABD2C195_VESSQ
MEEFYVHKMSDRPYTMLESVHIKTALKNVTSTSIFLKLLILIRRYIDIGDTKGCDRKSVVSLSVRCRQAGDIDTTNAKFMMEPD